MKTRYRRPRPHPADRCGVKATNIIRLDAGSTGPARRPAATSRRGGFTLLELMVVIGLIVVLLATFFVVGQSVVTGAKERNTTAMMLLAASAIDEFHRAAPLGQHANYVKRYADYPPCELEVFTGGGLMSPPASVSIRNLTPGAAGAGAELSLNSVDPGFAAITNRDIKAMLLAIRTFSEAGSQILDRIDSRYRRTGDLADSFVAPDRAIEYLDRDGDGAVNLGDTPLELLVDDWGQPIAYFSTRIVAGPAATAEQPRQVLSDAWVRVNNGVPVLMSYGANGADQFDTEFIAGAGASDVVTDWNGDDGSNAGVLDNSLNADNLFVSQSLKQQLGGNEP